MKGAAFLFIVLFLVAVLTVPVRCDMSLVNAQFTLTNSSLENSAKSYFINLTSGETVGITLQVSGQGVIIFSIDNSTSDQIFEHSDIRTDGWQGQWTAPYNGRFDFTVSLNLYPGLGDEATVSFAVTSAGTGNPDQGGGGGGFDAVPIVVAVILVLAWLVSMFLIIRMREQPPSASPAEEPPPPPPTS
jgi:hypothetical protein